MARQWKGKRDLSGAMVRQWAALTCLLLPGWGCSESGEPGDVETPLARKATVSFNSPLDDDDIRTFLAVCSDLPGQKAPEFAPLAQTPIDGRLPATTLVNAYRREFRRLFDPMEQAARWRRDAALMKVLESHHLEAEVFAVLQAQIGCALAATTMSSSRTLAESASRVEGQLQKIVAQLDEFDHRATSQSLNAVQSAQRRQPLVDQLRDLVALGEFLELIRDVPQESRAAIAAHQQELSRLVPTSGDLRNFERTLDATGVIVPVNFEEQR